MRRVTRDKMVQIFHESSRNHWVLVAVQTDTCIAELYDTIYTTVSAEMIANICATMPADQRNITVKLMNAQRQRGNSDCGVFACANKR